MSQGTVKTLPGKLFDCATEADVACATHTQLEREDHIAFQNEKTEPGDESVGVGTILLQLRTERQRQMRSADSWADAMSASAVA